MQQYLLLARWRIGQHHYGIGRLRRSDVDRNLAPRGQILLSAEEEGNSVGRQVLPAYAQQQGAASVGPCPRATRRLRRLAGPDPQALHLAGFVEQRGEPRHRVGRVAPGLLGDAARGIAGLSPIVGRVQ